MTHPVRHTDCIDLSSNSITLSERTLFVAEDQSIRHVGAGISDAVLGSLNIDQPGRYECLFELKLFSSHAGQNMSLKIELDRGASIIAVCPVHVSGAYSLDFSIEKRTSISFKIRSFQTTFELGSIKVGLIDKIAESSEQKRARSRNELVEIISQAEKKDDIRTKFSEASRSGSLERV